MRYVSPGGMQDSDGGRGVRQRYRYEHSVPWPEYVYV